MAESQKPWEKYKSGPWEKYQDSAPPQQQSTLPHAVDDMPELWGEVLKPATEDMPALMADEPIIPDPDPPFYTPLDNVSDMAHGLAKDVIGTGELGLMAASGGVADINAGFIAAVAAASGPVSGVSMSQSADFIRYWQDALTLMPKTERGKQMLESMVGPVIAADEYVDAIATGDPSDPNSPMVSATIKTLIYGALDLAIPGKDIASTVKAKATWVANKRKVNKLAHDLGLKLKQPHKEVGELGISQSVIDMAAKMSPEERAANMPALKAAMTQEKIIARARKNAQYGLAKRSRTYVTTGAVEDLAIDTRRILTDDHFLELKDYPHATKLLDELGAFSQTKGLTLNARNLRDMERLRRQAGAKAMRFKDEAFAFNAIKREISSFMEIGYVNAMKQAGRQYIRGDLAGVRAWDNARLFNAGIADKAIVKLIESESTPEDFLSYIIGASASGSKKHAGATVRRMKEVLGPDHPAIKGMRSDLIYEIVMPVLKRNATRKDLGAFVNNYDNLILKNKSLVNELGLELNDMKILYHSAKVAKDIPAWKAAYGITDITRAASQIFVGHEIAKAGLRVRFASGVLNKFLEVDSVPHRQVLAALTGELYGVPAIPRRSVLAAEFAVGAGLSDIAEAGLTIDEDNQ